MLMACDCWSAVEYAKDTECNDRSCVHKSWLQNQVHPPTKWLLSIARLGLQAPAGSSGEGPGEGRPAHRGGGSRAGGDCLAAAAPRFFLVCPLLPAAQQPQQLLLERLAARSLLPLLSGAACRGCCGALALGGSARGRSRGGAAGPCDAEGKAAQDLKRSSGCCCTTQALARQQDCRTHKQIMPVAHRPRRHPPRPKRRCRTLWPQLPPPHGWPQRRAGAAPPPAPVAAG